MDSTSGGGGFAAFSGLGTATGSLLTSGEGGALDGPSSFSDLGALRIAGRFLEEAGKEKIQIDSSLHIQWI